MHAVRDLLLCTWGPQRASWVATCLKAVQVAPKGGCRTLGARPPLPCDRDVFVIILIIEQRACMVLPPFPQKPVMAPDHAV